MESRRIILGGVVLFLLIAGILLFFRSKAIDKKLILTSTPTPQKTSNLESRFNLQISPTGQKTNLVPNNIEGEGLVTRDYKDGRFIQTIVANLPDSNQNEFYQGWLEKGSKGDSNYNLISLGKLTMEKGGFLLDYESAKDYSDYKKVIVSKETKNDGLIEVIVLQGSFN